MSRYLDDEVAEFEDAVCTQETAKAVLVFCNGVSAWIPKSQVHEDSEVFANGDAGRLTVKLWWAEKEGLFE